MSTMRKIEPGDPETHSADPVAANVERLKELFPEAVTEGKIDFEVLKQLLGGEVEEREERYGLNWHGKRRARQLALTPSTGTLRPCPEESVDWETTKNLFIEGDNLEVLKLLQKSYAGKVKLIYIDPPYNTGKDFVYPDDYRDNLKNYLELTGQAEGGRILRTNPDSNGRFHTDWLNMMYPRLKLARDLLSEDGAIFISIDDSELANLREVCDELFGQECFAGCVTRVTGTPTGGGNRSLVNEIDHVLVYFKSPGVPIEGVEFDEEDAEIYDKQDENGRYLTRLLRRTGGEDRREDRPTMFYPLTAPDGTEVLPIAPAGYESRWGCSKETYLELQAKGLIEWAQVERDGQMIWQVYQKYYLEGRLKQPSNLWQDLEGNKKATRDLKALFGGEKVFSFPKPVGLVRHIVQLAANEPDALVLDFFAGSGTTGHAVIEQNAADGGRRRYVLVQLPEPLDPQNKSQRVAYRFCETNGLSPNIAELSKERLRRAARKLKRELPVLACDLGFRVMRLDSSNIREWEGDSGELGKELQASIENLKADRSEADILNEVLLKLGLDLCVPIDKRTFAGKDVHSVGGGVLMACLAPKIATAEVEEIGLGIARWREELKVAGETTCVFRDSAFEDDIAKTNLVAILVQSGIDEKFIRSL